MRASAYQVWPRLHLLIGRNVYGAVACLTMLLMQFGARLSRGEARSGRLWSIKRPSRIKLELECMEISCKAIRSARLMVSVRPSDQAEGVGEVVRERRSEVAKRSDQVIRSL